MIFFPFQVLSGRSEVLSLAMQDRILGSQIMERHPLHLPQHQPPRRGLILILFQARYEQLRSDTHRYLKITVHHTLSHTSTVLISQVCF